MELTIPDRSSLLGDLAALDSWLATLCVPARSTDRIHQLVRLLTELNPQRVGPKVKITKEQRRAYMYALAELIEFHQIFTPAPRGRCKRASAQTLARLVG